MADIDRTDEVPEWLREPPTADELRLNYRCAECGFYLRPNRRKDAIAPVECIRQPNHAGFTPVPPPTVPTEAQIKHAFRTMEMHIGRTQI